MIRASRYVTTTDDDALRLLRSVLRPGAVVCVSDAPIGERFGPDDAERHHRFVRVLDVARDRGRVVSLTVDWYGVARTVAGGALGVVGAML